MSTYLTVTLKGQNVPCSLVELDFQVVPRLGQADVLAAKIGVYDEYKNLLGTWVLELPARAVPK